MTDLSEPSPMSDDALITLKDGLAAGASGVAADTVRRLIRRADDLERIVALSDELNALYKSVVDAVPECPRHGAGCVANALEWIEKAKARENPNSVVESLSTLVAVLDGAVDSVRRIVARFETAAEAEVDEPQCQIGEGHACTEACGHCGRCCDCYAVRRS